jgi:hypothetical protein
MDIKDVLKAFNDMEAAGLFDRYAIGGAVGALFYLEPTDTADIDIFISLSAEPDRIIVDLSPIYDYLKGKGGSLHGEHIRVFGWPVQVLAVSGGLVEEALKEAKETAVEGVRTRVFSAEHLAAIALQTGRAKDKARLLQFLESAALDHVKLMDIFERRGLNAAWDKFKAQFLDDRK